MLTLEEAITHCEEVADGHTEQGKCPECAMEHRQLAEWLTELKGYRERMPYDNEGIAPKSITTAFQFGIVMGFGKKYDEMDKVMEEVKKAVSPQPRRGHWINAKVGKLFPSNDSKCSECGNILDFNGVNCGRGDANYCPNCGAKMEIEEMTREEREEAIAELNTFKIGAKSELGENALDIAIETLNQESCGDCISRQAVLDAIEDDNRNGWNSCFASNNDAQCFKNTIRDLPSVNPQRTGHWIDVKDKNGNWKHKCSSCNQIYDINFRRAEANIVDNYFCPHCGCAMFEPQESEGKDADSN